MIGMGITGSVTLCVVLVLAAAVFAQAPASGPGPATKPSGGDSAPGVVCNVKVLSDKVADVSSVEAWRKSCLKPGMSDREKAIAAWQSVVAHQHQNSPPSEFLHSPENAVLDPIKMFNVYGYSLCSVHASHMAAMARAAGLVARNQSIQRHCVAEVLWDGRWHMLDASLVNYFPKADGDIASVDEIIAATGELYKEHPDLKNNPDALEKFRKDGLWKKGPALLAGCPFYDKEGLLSANWPWQCGWQETMREYDGSRQFIYEPGYSMGYRVNVQLRAGERLTRNWSNKGLHVEMDSDSKDKLTCLDAKVGEGPMSYSPKYGDLAPGRIGNGVHEYVVPLAAGAFRWGAMEAENLEARAEDSPTVRVKDTAKPGVLVIRMPSSYVYLTGSIELNAHIGEGGKLAILYSENNGMDWREIKTFVKSAKETIDISSLVFRRYDYRLKFEMTGARTGLEGLAIRHDIQHSQRPLPALAEGDNKITFSAQPSEGTVTIEGSALAANRGKQVLYTDFHPQQENIAEPMISVKGRNGFVAFPVATPGAMKRIRIFAFYRAMDKRDCWDVSASFDGGKTFVAARAEALPTPASASSQEADGGSLVGPFKAMGKQLVVADVPSGTTSALVRFAGTQADKAMLFNVRIDADYDEPAGGFAPIKVTYVWEEGGAEKSDVHVARKPQEAWTIHCAAKPTMKSLVVERAQ